MASKPAGIAQSIAEEASPAAALPKKDLLFITIVLVVWVIKIAKAGNNEGFFANRHLLLA